MSFLNWLKTSEARDDYEIQPSTQPWEPPASQSNARDLGAASATYALDAAIQNQGVSDRGRILAANHVCRDVLGHGPNDLTFGLMDLQGVDAPAARPLSPDALPEPAQEAIRDACFEAREVVTAHQMSEPKGNVRTQADTDNEILGVVRRSVKGYRKKFLPW